MIELNIRVDDPTPTATLIDHGFHEAVQSNNDALTYELYFDGAAYFEKLSGRERIRAVTVGVSDHPSRALIELSAELYKHEPWITELEALRSLWNRDGE